MAPKKRARDVEPEADITLVVGASEVQLAAHSLVLCQQSCFFRAALQGGWEEAQTRSVRLPDNEPEDIELLLKVLSFELFIGRATVVKLARLFSQFSMSQPLITQAEDVLFEHGYETEYLYDDENAASLYWGLPEGASGSIRCR